MHRLRNNASFMCCSRSACSTRRQMASAVSIGLLGAAVEGRRPAACFRRAAAAEAGLTGRAGLPAMAVAGMNLVLFC